MLSLVNYGKQQSGFGATDSKKKWNIYKSNEDEYYLVPNARNSSPHCPVQAVPLTPILNALNSVEIPVVANFNPKSHEEPSMCISKKGIPERLDFVI